MDFAPFVACCCIRAGVGFDAACVLYVREEQMPVGFNVVDIANMALGYVGQDGVIESFSENSEEARVCGRWFKPARLATLEAYNWGFARKRLPLAGHSIDPPSNGCWKYRYVLPSDMVAARYIENPLGPDADAVPYDIENAGDGTVSLLTDQENATLVYTFDLESVSLFSMHFCIMCALQLGIFINPQLTGKAAIANRLQAQFNVALGQAPTVDASQSIPCAARDASWIRERT